MAGSKESVKSISREKVVHQLLPVYDKSSGVLILGSIPSPKSRENGFYYGHERNRFWRVMARVFEEAVPETNEESRSGRPGIMSIRRTFLCWR